MDTTKEDHQDTKKADHSEEICESQSDPTKETSMDEQQAMFGAGDAADHALNRQTGPPDEDEPELIEGDPVSGNQKALFFRRLWTLLGKISNHFTIMVTNTCPIIIATTFASCHF